MTNYYVKNGGNDYNTGLSDAQAWETITKVNSHSFSTSDCVYFKCGDTWTDTQLTIDWDGTSTNRVVIGAYYMDGTEQIGLSGNKPVIKKSTLTGNNLITSGYSYITIENLDLQRANTGLYGIDSDYLLIQNNDIGEGSTWGIRLTAITRQMYGTVIRNNTIDSHILTYGQVPETDLWDAIAMVGSANDYEVYNNTIKDFGHTAIQLWGENPSYTVTNCNIYNNYIDGANSDHLRGFAIIGTYTTNCTIHHNYMTNFNADSKVQGSYNEVYHNIISNVRDSGITSNGIGMLLTGSGDFECHHNKIYNNTIYNTDSAGIGLKSGDGTSINIEHNEIVNNIFFDTGNCTISGSGCNSPNDALRIYIWGGTSLIKNNIYKNNIVYTPGKTTNMVYYKKSSTESATQYDTMTAFETAINGVDGNTISGNIDSDPKLTNPSSDDFTLQSDSPAINAGIDVGLPFTGSAPDIGAIEYTTHVDPCEGVLPNWICEVDINGDNTGWKIDQNNCYDNEYDTVMCTLQVGDPCENVTCPNICDFETHIKYVNGRCIDGECLYDEEINSVDCGYIPEEPKPTNVTDLLIKTTIGIGLLKILLGK